MASLSFFLFVMCPDFIVVKGELLSDHYSALLITVRYINCVTSSSQLSSFKMLIRPLLCGCSKVPSEVKWHFFFYLKIQ